MARVDSELYKCVRNNKTLSKIYFAPSWLPGVLARPSGSEGEERQGRLEDFEMMGIIPGVITDYGAAQSWLILDFDRNNVGILRLIILIDWGVFALTLK